ncbi:hypothetical protein [Pandoraea sp. ISTKB]|uniref:hypothetical protein n=1 Tax=Pandoraea sp. ISTKB TaxID=1586708 RepID=UPI00084735EE|nr:hypothetical protein [Pandoraea sp. ISTKB]ODP34088.1 hypothetical protein A9762_03170 [Pandoraea sp. ISTKB]
MSFDITKYFVFESGNISIEETIWKTLTENEDEDIATAAVSYVMETLANDGYVRVFNNKGLMHNWNRPDDFLGPKDEIAEIRSDLKLSPMNV